MEAAQNNIASSSLTSRSTYIIFNRLFFISQIWLPFFFCVSLQIWYIEFFCFHDIISILLSLIYIQKDLIKEGWTTTSRTNDNVDNLYNELFRGYFETKQIGIFFPSRHLLLELIQRQPTRASAHGNLLDLMTQITNLESNISGIIMELASKLSSLTDLHFFLAEARIRTRFWLGFWLLLIWFWYNFMLFDGKNPSTLFIEL